MMVFNKFRRFLGLFPLFLLFLLPLNIHESVASYRYTEKYFHLKGGQEFLTGMEQAVANEAIVQFNCHLFPNSTSNITLVIELITQVTPPPEWNVSRKEVGIGQNITFTVTNGVVLTPPSDVATGFRLWIHLEPEIAEVWVKVSATIIYSGWFPDPVPGYLFPGFLSLLLFGVIRSWKTRKKNKLEKICHS